MNDLFLEADKELANEYESDFEQEKEINNKKSSPSNKNDENSTSVLSILQKSAVQVEKEEKKKLDELFSDAKDEILAILDNNNSNNKFNNDVNALLEIESSERKYSIQNNDSKEEKVSREVILVGKEEKQKEESKDGEDDGNLYKDDPKYIRNIKNENFKLNKGKNKILLISSTKSNLKPFVKELLYNSENGDEENGIDLEYQDRHGWTALHWACRHNNLDIIKLFYTYYTKKVNKDFQILCNIKEETCGWTPLHVSYQIIVILSLISNYKFLLIF